MDQDHKRAELVRTAIQLARNLDMSVIAEGVETEQELSRLEAMGCDLIQGFLFSKPLPAERVDALLNGEPNVLAHAPHTFNLPHRVRPAAAALRWSAPRLKILGNRATLTLQPEPAENR